MCAVLAAAVSPAADSPLLWRDPGPRERLDLASGPGGREKAPQPPYVFQEEELRGTAPKVMVRDARGTAWMVKFGPEVKAETFASRLVWAAGYLTEPSYFVAEGKIEGADKLGRAGTFIQGGTFRDARFELRDGSSYRLVPGSKWSLDDKTLKGTKELSALKLVIMLLSNWDVKPENLAIVETGGKRYYTITDWGASMGRAGDFTLRSKWDCKAFTTQSAHFVNGVSDGYVGFTFHGKAAEVISNGIRVEDVRWFMQRIGKLSDRQISAALLASGATGQEAACFTTALRQRLTQLAAVGTSSTDSGHTVTQTTIEKRTVTTPQP